MAIGFSKYQGLGNDFILIDNRQDAKPIINSTEATLLCDRHFGIGGDGVILLLPGTSDTDYTMRIFNSDGSEPEMCGNGIRCLAQFIADLENKTTEKIYHIQTLAGTITTHLLKEGLVTVDMGEPQLKASQIPTLLGIADQPVINQPLQVKDQTWLVTCVSMGNPHCITFVENVESISLELIGPEFEDHPAFPKRINTEFIEIIAADQIKMRVWERGAGITLACGTGACAAVVAGVLSEKTARRCKVDLPGGSLEIYWSELDQKVYMSGPTKKVFVGQWG